MRFARLVLILVVLQLAAGPVLAGTPAADEAASLLARGVELRRQGKTAEALELFLKSQALAPSARTLAQIGSAEVALQNPLAAEEHLAQALALHDSPWIENPGNRAALTKLLDDVRAKIGRIRFQGLAGAQVTVDGKSVGQLPLVDAVHVVASPRIRIEARAAGRRDFAKEIEVAGGVEVTVDVALAPLVPVALAPSPPPSVEVVPSTAPTVVAQAAEPSRPAWRWWVGGATVAAGLAAGAAGVLWLSLDGDPTCTPPPGAFCAERYQTKTQGWIAVALGATGVAAGGLLLLWPSSEHPVRAAIGPGSLALSTRF